jgi:ElaB/YqjD/DUF883 family membrane-anchored ribosome-binding protein
MPHATAHGTTHGATRGTAHGVASHDTTIADTRDELAADLKSVIDDAEALLAATADQTGERILAARSRAESSLKAARARLSALGDPIVDSAKAAAKTTDEFVHEHPWGAVGLAAVAGLIAGVLIARR